MTRPWGYFRAREIAELTRLSLRTVRRRIADEIIPSTKLGGTRLVAKADLERLLSPTPNLPEEPDDGEE